MSTERRFVFDTNVLISALLLRRSVARQALDKALREGRLLLSQETVEELHAVLRRREFERYVTEEERIEFITAFVREGIWVEIHERVTACRDPRDDKFLELAVNGRALCIVSGDNDLLALHPFRGISILTPREFLDTHWEAEEG